MPIRNISYFVQSRPGNLFAVLRRGPKGGVRVVEVYDNELSANFIRDSLNGAAVHVK